MTDLAAALREIAEPSPPRDRIKTAIGRAALATGLSYWRTFDLWYGKARRVESDERVRINEALAMRRAEAARHELDELKDRIARLEELLSRGKDRSR